MMKGLNQHFLRVASGKSTQLRLMTKNVKYCKISAVQFVTIFSTFLCCRFFIASKPVNQRHLYRSGNFPYFLN